VGETEHVNARIAFRDRVARMTFATLAVSALGAPLLGWGAASATMTCGLGSSLVAGCSLDPGHELKSTNGQFTLALQTDGNVVEYDAFRVAIWSNGVRSLSPSTRLTLLADGDLIERSDAQLLWASGTIGSASVRLVVQSDGNVVLHALSGVTWSTHSGSPFSDMPTGTTQIIAVTSTNIRTSIATVTPYQLDNGIWQLRFPSSPSDVGRDGWRSPRLRREGDGTTPLGVYGIGSTLYGTGPLPLTTFPVRRIVPGDYWDENPATGARYNTFQQTRVTNCARDPFGGDSECLWEEGAAARVFVAMGFNTPSRGAYGSAIFLHAGTAPTQGCVAVPMAYVLRLVTWLSPSSAPLVVLAGPMRLSLER
jgi:L,D-peptidoglycan transpeptidase YkuD (ErfK/YbiS/YcfS/YnhG family)